MPEPTSEALARIRLEKQPGSDALALREVEGDAAGMHFVIPSTAAPREFIHVQAVPAVKWGIQHGLGVRYPHVILTDAEGAAVFPLPVWETATANWLELSFQTPASGKAILRA